MSQCCRKIKDTVQQLASDHKDIHSSVSRVGKAIDRVSRAHGGVCLRLHDRLWLTGPIWSYLSPTHPTRTLTLRSAVLCQMRCGTLGSSSIRFCRQPLWSTCTSRACLVWLKSCARYSSSASDYSHSPFSPFPFLAGLRAY